ncbi:MAG: hypothetical protein ACFFE6_00785 [Candidatus Thorarchaeota archaeon]
MKEKASELTALINDENVSAIQTMVDELEISPEEVQELIQELLASGAIQGSMTEDGKRFFKSDVKLSDAPSIPIGDQTPSFMKFDTRPGIIASVAGLAVIIFGLIINSNAIPGLSQETGVIVLFIGIIILFSGMYCLSMRKTPS